MLQHDIDNMLYNVYFAYDDEMKKRYFLENPEFANMSVRSVKFHLQVLRALANFEAENNIGLIKMSPEYIEDFFKNFGTSSLISMRSYISAVRSYIIFIQNHFYSTDTYSLAYIYFTSCDEGEDKKRARSFINSDMLKNQIFTPLDIDNFVYNTENYDLQIMCYMVLIWEGMKFEEIQNLKVQNIRFFDDTVYIESNDKKYTSKYVDLFRKATSLLKYDVLTEKSKIVEMEFKKSDYLIKRSESRTKNYYEDEPDLPLGKERINYRIRNLGIAVGSRWFKPKNVQVSRLLYDLIEHFGTDTTLLSWLEVKNYLKENSEYSKVDIELLIKKMNIMIDKLNAENTNND